VYELSPELIRQFPVPLYDVEIGSVRSSWEDSRAAAVVACAVQNIARHVRPMARGLFIGGVHFEPACNEAAFHAEHPVAFAHILPNQWIANRDYEGQEGLDRFRAAAASIAGGLDVIAFHDKLKGPHKACARALGQELGIPVVNHRRLRSEAFEITSGARS
jgi:D-tyrosyl-tRNA(Tyr) deacylase